MVSPKAFQMLLDNTNCISICYNGNVYTENIDNHLQVVTYIMGLHLKTELCPQSPCYFITSFIAGMEFDAVRNVILHLMVVEWNLWSFCCFQQNFFFIEKPNLLVCFKNMPFFCLLLFHCRGNVPENNISIHKVLPCLA